MTSSSRQELIVIGIPVLLVGGTEVHTLALVRTLLNSGRRVTVCCYYEWAPSMVSAFKEAGADLTTLDLQRTDGLFKLFFTLRSLFRQLRPDVVHVQYVAPGLVPVLAARLSGVPTVFATVHIAGKVAYHRKAKLLLRIAARFCTAFFCVSKGVEEFWFGKSEVFRRERLAGRRHYTVYNGVDTDAIGNAVTMSYRTDLRGRLALENYRVIGVVGRLAYQKGHAVLLDAMVEIIQRFPNALVFVVGDGPEAQPLREQACHLAIEKHIRWLGPKTHDEVIKLYSVMDVIAMPSLYEGFGLVAVEAMAAERPVVGTHVAGLEEIIEPSVTGYLVPPGDSKALAGAICDLLANPSLALTMGKNGKNRAACLFSLDRFRSTILSAYQALVKEPA